ncbi:MAG: hypothetical protein AAGG50_22315, partial [Bacteroidota bacterium]
MSLSVHLRTDLQTGSPQADFERLVAARAGLADLLTRADDAATADLVIDGAGIALGLPWNDERPPYRFPALPLTEVGLLAACNLALGDYETAHQHLAGQPDVQAEVVLAHHITHGLPVDDDLLASLRVVKEEAAERGRQAHNRAV